METVKDVLRAYVKQHGPATVLVNGDYVDIEVDGVDQVNHSSPDVYVVSNTGIDADVAARAKLVLYQSSGKISLKSNTEPKGSMGALPHTTRQLTANLVAFHTVSLPESAPEPAPEPVVEATTIAPEDVPEVTGVGVSIAGAVDGEDAEEEPVEEEPEEDSDDDRNDASGMVW